MWKFIAQTVLSLWNINFLLLSFFFNSSVETAISVADKSYVMKIQLKCPNLFTPSHLPVQWVFAGLILVPGPYVQYPCVRPYFADWVFQTNIATRTHNPQNASECVNISLYNLNPGAPKEIWGRVMSSPSLRPLQCCACQSGMRC